MCALCVALFLSLILDPSGNGKLELNEIAAKFKPTIYFNYKINIDNIKETEVNGAITLKHADKKRHIYTEQHKIQKTISYLNTIPLAEASRDELPNKSPDVTIHFKGFNEETVGFIRIYGEVFIEDGLTGKLYRSKKNLIIEGIENMDFD